MATLIGDFRKPVDPKALAAKGLSGALRYWPKQGGSTTVVGLTAAEIGRYTAAQVPLGTIYEARSASWMSGGAAAGEQAARYLAGLFRQAGGTGWRPASLYLAADANTISTTATNACLDAAAQVFGWKPDLYAFAPELESAHSGGHSRRSWLTGHFPGDSIAAVQRAMPWLHLYQCQGSQPAGIPTIVTVSGVQGDVDIVLRPDWNTAVTSPIDKLTADQVDLLLGVAQRYAPGNTGGQKNPAGDMATEIFAVRGLIADAVDALTGQLGALAADVAALKAGQPAATLSGTAQVTVNLEPGSPA